MEGVETRSLAARRGPRTLFRNAGAGDRSGRARLALLVLGLLLLVIAGTSLGTGPTGASAIAVLRDWLSGADAGLASQRDQLVVLQIRLPRVIMGICVGAALAVSGAIMQGLFRNPLADPGIVGVSSGASLGAVSVIVLGDRLLGPAAAAAISTYLLPAAAFCGAIAITFLLYRISTRQGRTSVATLLLAGIALGAMALAVIGFLTFIADDRQLRDLTFWSLGSLAGATWSKATIAAIIVFAALLAGPFLSRGLDALALGEASANHLGISVQRLKYLAVVAVSAATGAAVAVSGGIAFVGIVVPHLLRLVIGPGHRYLLPASALLGASFLLLADSVARTVAAPAELPIGIVTAAVGGPFFLWILLRRRGLIDL